MLHQRPSYTHTFTGFLQVGVWHFHKLENGDYVFFFFFFFFFIIIFF